MAARRLIAVLLVLLFISSLAAALAPVQPREDAQEEPAPVESPSSAVEPAEGGSLLGETITADAKKPPVVRASAGDQLQLTVRVEEAATFEVRDLGETEDADPLSPARFDLFLTQPGTYSITTLNDPQREVGTIEVAPQ